MGSPSVTIADLAHGSAACGMAAARAGVDSAEAVAEDERVLVAVNATVPCPRSLAAGAGDAARGLRLVAVGLAALAAGAVLLRTCA